MIECFRWDGQPAEPGDYVAVAEAWRRGEHFPPLEVSYIFDPKLPRAVSFAVCGPDPRNPDQPAVLCTLWTNARERIVWSGLPEKFGCCPRTRELLGQHHDTPFIVETRLVKIQVFVHTNGAWHASSTALNCFLSLVCDRDELPVVTVADLHRQPNPLGCRVLYAFAAIPVVFLAEHYPDQNGELMAQLAMWLQARVADARRARLRAALMGTRRGPLSCLPVDVLGMVAEQVMAPATFDAAEAWAAIKMDRWAMVSPDPARRAAAMDAFLGK